MTISELAQSIGVSKTAVRKKYNSIPDFSEKYISKTENGTIEISPDGCKLIAETFRKPPQTAENKAETVTENQVSATMIEILRQQLEEKDRQIEKQQEQISQLTAALEHTTSSLQAAQALHAGTMQQQLLTDGTEPEPEAVPESEPEPKKKKHWWSRK